MAENEQTPGPPHQGVRNVAQAPKLWQTPDRVWEPLYAIVPLTNFWRSKARWKHFLRAIEHFVRSGAVVYVIEAALHERDHAVDVFMPHRVGADCGALGPAISPDCRHDDPYRGQHRYIRLRKREDDGLWLKENLITLARGYLPKDAKYFCFLDGDIAFQRPAWVAECIQLLQEYKVLQMFSAAHDLDANYEIVGTRPSFVAQWMAGKPIPEGYYGRARAWAGAWSGLAWAWRTETFDRAGGIPDWCIHGGGDWHLAWALIEQAERSLRADLHPSYRKKLLWHQARYHTHVRQNVGVMKGSVVHMHHGPKRLRHYSDRHALLARTQFDPETDLSRDGQGLYQLVDDDTPRYVTLRDGMRRYAMARNEDDPNL